MRNHHLMVYSLSTIDQIVLVHLEGRGSSCSMQWRRDPLQPLQEGAVGQLASHGGSVQPGGRGVGNECISPKTLGVYPLFII